jgi:hypothetical protein
LLAHNDQDNGGSTLINTLLNNMIWSFDFDLFSERPRKNVNTSKSRGKIKMTRLLVNRGAKWIPRARGYINNAHMALLKMRADNTGELIESLQTTDLDMMSKN